MNLNSQNEETNENKIIVYDIKKDSQAIEEQDIHTRHIDNDINNYNDNIKIVYENMNKYYNIQEKNQELKEIYSIAQSDDNNIINYNNIYTDMNNDYESDRQKVKKPKKMGKLLNLKKKKKYVVVAVVVDV